jgi:glutamate racemase
VSDLPIGIFDSGIGGLTVLAALERHLPHESFVYLGDTARLPYGTKSASTVTRYAVRAAHALTERGIKLLVVACNTASAIALDALEKEFQGLPVLGVVRPGAAAAARVTHSRRIAVLSTEGTAREGAYVREIHRHIPNAEVVSIACPIFVALAEEGWTQGPIVEAVAREYLNAVFLNGTTPAPDTLVLGCTHFPPLRDTIQQVVGNHVAIVDSAETTAEFVHQALRSGKIARETSGAPRTVHVLATDAPDRFARVARHFLPPELVPDTVELVDHAPRTG